MRISYWSSDVCSSDLSGSLERPMVKRLGASGGTVLVACGADNDQYLHSAEFYDPDTESWTPTDGLFYERFGASAHMLPNGRVMGSEARRVGNEVVRTCRSWWDADP